MEHNRSKEEKLTAFELAVFGNLEKVPRGRVTTYGELARATGYPGAARAVGNALHKNPHAPRVPCHRVVKCDGHIGGYGGGAVLKKELLEKEGVQVKNGKIRDFKKIVYKY